MNEQQVREIVQQELTALSTGSAILMPREELSKLREDAQAYQTLCKEYGAQAGRLGEVIAAHKLNADNAAQRPGGADVHRNIIDALDALTTECSENPAPASRHWYGEILRKHWPAPPSHAEARDAIPELTVADVLKGEQEIRDGKFVASKPCPSCGKPSLAVALHGGSCCACTNTKAAAESAISDEELGRKASSIVARTVTFGAYGQPIRALLSRSARPLTGQALYEALQATNVLPGFEPWDELMISKRRRFDQTASRLNPGTVAREET